MTNILLLQRRKLSNAWIASTPGQRLLWIIQYLVWLLVVCFLIFIGLYAGIGNTFIIGEYLPSPLLVITFGFYCLGVLCYGLWIMGWDVMSRRIPAIMMGLSLIWGIPVLILCLSDFRTASVFLVIAGLFGYIHAWYVVYQAYRGKKKNYPGLWIKKTGDIQKKS